MARTSTFLTQSLVRAIRAHCRRTGADPAAWLHDAIAEKLRREGATNVPQYQSPGERELARFLRTLKRELVGALAKHQPRRAAG